MKTFRVTEAVSTHAWNPRVRDFDVKAPDFESALAICGDKLATGVTFKLDGCGPYHSEANRSWPGEAPKPWKPQTLEEYRWATRRMFGIERPGDPDMLPGVVVHNGVLSKDQGIA